jgi:3-methyl-2-oxobutanoate hydroxymethyltransferase
MVLECVPAALGAEITRGVSVPVIGIGAGPDCDGQILVTHDLLGLHAEVAPKFVKRYARLGEEMEQAFTQYKADVEASAFPDEEHTY